MTEQIDIDAYDAMVSGVLLSCTNIQVLEDNLNNKLAQAKTESSPNNPVRNAPSVNLAEPIQVIYGYRAELQTRLDLARAVAAATIPGFDINARNTNGCTVTIDDSVITNLPGIIDAARSQNITAEQWDILMAMFASDQPEAKWFVTQLSDAVGAEALELLQANLSWYWHIQATRLATKIANGEPISDEDWGIIIDMSRSNSPEAARFGAEFFNGIDPSRLGQLVQDMSNRMATTPAGQEQYNARVAALGELLGAASRSQLFPPLRADYAQDIVALMTTPGSSASPAAALSLVLSHGTYDTTFTLKVSEGLYNYERSPDFRGWMSQDPRWSSVVDENGHVLVDPMTGVMTMLGNNPEAAQEFFLNGGTVTFEVHTTDPDGNEVVFTIQVSERMRFLLFEHHWENLPDGPYGSDNGAGLGYALWAATTGSRTDGQSQAETSAMLVSMLFALTGERLRGPDGWEMPDGMRDLMALITADYMPSLFVADNEGWYVDLSGPLWKDISQYFPYSRVGAVFTKEDVEAMLRSLGKNPDQTAILGLGWAQAMDAWLLTQCGTDYPTEEARIDALRGIMIGLLASDILIGTDVLNMIMDNAFKGNSDDAMVEAEKAAMRNAFLDVLTSAPIPVLKQAGLIKDVAKWALERAQKLGMEWLAKLQSATTAEEKLKLLQKYNDSLDKAAEDLVVQVLFDAGFWDADTMEWAQEHYPELGFTPPPTNLDGTLNQDGAEYREWLNQNAGLKALIDQIIATSKLGHG